MTDGARAAPARAGGARPGSPAAHGAALLARLTGMFATWIVAGASLAGAAPGAPSPGAVLVDDRGRVLSLPDAPKRIVSLAPHATELLFSAGLGARVVAIDRDSDHPPEALALPRVAALPQPSVERLLALRPDLVVAWGPGVRPGFVEQMAAFGVPVFVSEPRTLDDVADTLARFAAFGNAERDAGGFAARLSALRARWSSRDPVRVFVQIWASPLVTISDRDVIGDAIRSCGGINVAGTLPAAAPRIDIEAVLAARPRLIVATDSAETVSRWREIGLLAPEGPARFVHIDATALQRPGPRVLEAVEALCEAIDSVR